MKFRNSFLLCLCMVGNLACKLPKKDEIGQRQQAIDSLQQKIIVIKKQKITLLLRYAQSKYNFNGNVLVGEAGNIWLEKSYGIADLQQKKPLTLKTTFPIASLTQGFTATAILQLAERNKLRFNDDLTKYYPNFPYKNIQIQHLLRQTSGIPDYLTYFFTPKNQPLTHAYKQNIMDWVLQEAPPLRFPTHKAQAISSTNYVLLADIIERVSGVSFGQYLEENIFNPLGMKQTYLKTHNKAPTFPRATGYYDDLVRLADESYVDYVYGDSGIQSTVSDLYKWEQALYKQEILSKKAVEQFSVPTVLGDEKIKPYSIAWTRQKAGKVLVQQGQWLGFSASIWRIPENKQTIIILNNTQNKYVGKIAEAIYAILQNEPYKLPE